MNPSSEHIWNAAHFAVSKSDFMDYLASQRLICSPDPRARALNHTYYEAIKATRMAGIQQS